MVEEKLLVPMTNKQCENDMDDDECRSEIWRHAKAIGLAHSFPSRKSRRPLFQGAPRGRLLWNQARFKILQPQKYRDWCRAFRDPVWTGLLGLVSCTEGEAHSIRRGLRILRIALAGVVVEKQYCWEDATQSSTTEPSS